MIVNTRSSPIVLEYSTSKKWIVHELDNASAPMPKCIPYKLDFHFESKPTLAHTVFYQYIISLICMNKLNLNSATKLIVDDTPHNVSFTYLPSPGEKIVIPYILGENTKLTIRTTTVAKKHAALKINVMK